MMELILTLRTDSGRTMHILYDPEYGTVFAEMQDTGFTFRYNQEEYPDSTTAAQLIRAAYHGEEPDVDELSDDDILPCDDIDIEKARERAAEGR